jgi:hypothetical protein
LSILKCQITVLVRTGGVPGIVSDSRLRPPIELIDHVVITGRHYSSGKTPPLAGSDEHPHSPRLSRM